MHPEIREEKPGRCPKCGMKLVTEGEHEEPHVSHGTHTSWKDYLPLIVVISLLFFTSLAISYSTVFTLSTSISNFMIGFFLVFGGFKLMDIKGFAEGYSTYDLLAKRWFSYGYVYPFIELFFAYAMIFNLFPSVILWLEIIIMTFSGIGVAIKLARHEKFQCACLGTFLKVPLTKITLIEDFGMAFLALVMLILR